MHLLLGVPRVHEHQRVKSIGRGDESQGGLIPKANGCLWEGEQEEKEDHILGIWWGMWWGIWWGRLGPIGGRARVMGPTDAVDLQGILIDVCFHPIKYIQWIGVPPFGGGTLGGGQ